MNTELWQHSHSFGQDVKRPGERLTIIVIAITGTMMVVEIVTGILFGSMALLADGLHMASHAVALSINALAYIYARRHAHDNNFSFGTGKVNALGGFSGAVILAMFAIMMLWESVHRIFIPVNIIFNQAILVAFAGLAVNGISVFILGAGGNNHQHEHHHESGCGNRQHDDHNLKSAYLHVLADALTSILAIFALFAAKYFGLIWMDPVMGVVGAVLVARWSLGLLRVTSGVLLDREGPESIRCNVAECIEGDKDSKIADLHLWKIGPDIYASVITVVASNPATAEQYKSRIPDHLGIEHISIEVHKYSKSVKEKQHSEYIRKTNTL